MSQERVYEKIRKLLKMAHDTRGNETERETAMRQAYALLAKHNLEIADVDTAEGAEKRERQSTRMSSYPWARAIAYEIGKLFFCAYYFQRDSDKYAHHYFVGKQSNAITANEMAAYVVGSVFKELRTRFGSETSPEARSFATGVADTLRTRVYRMRADAEAATRAAVAPAPQEPVPDSLREHEGAAPVLALGGPAASTSRALTLTQVYANEQKANDDWIKDFVGDLRHTADRTKGSVKMSAYAAGKEHGGKISLHGQLGAGRSNTLKLK